VPVHRSTSALHIHVVALRSANLTVIFNFSIELDTDRIKTAFSAIVTRHSSQTSNQHKNNTLMLLTINHVRHQRERQTGLNIQDFAVMRVRKEQSSPPGD